MYRIMVVDDEEAIVEGITLLITRLVSDVEMIASAHDGEEGYQKALFLKPDIILTDIRMKEMDGIEMIRKLKSENIKSHFVILSGYSEFEDAKKALQLGVEDYIEKPVDEYVLQVTLNKICRSIAMEQKDRQDTLDLKHQVERYSEDMKAYLIKDLLEGSETGIRSRFSQLEQAGFPTENHKYICAIIQLHKSEDASELENFGSEFRKLCREYLQDKYIWELIPYTEHRFILPVAAEKGLNHDEIRFFLEKVRSEKKGRKLNGIGVGLIHYSIEGLKKSFEEAKCAIDYRVIKGTDSVIYYDELREYEGNPPRVAEADVKELEACMDKMDNQECERVIERIFGELEKEKYLTPEDLQVISMSLILSGIRKMPFMLIKMNEFLGEDILSLDWISRFDSIEQLKYMIINVLKGINEIMLTQGIPEKRDVIKEVKEYVRKNFDREITLAEISEKFFINPTYFSQLFKKRTGVTFRAYLADFRISRAKKLLEETNLRIYEISELVGYQDTNHFIKLFERSEGMTPGEYKKTL